MKSSTAKKVYIFAIVFIGICIFGLMLFFNFRTTLLVDDYAYFYIFPDDDESTGVNALHPPLDSPPVQSVKDIFASMAGHRQSMNGRVIPHGLVQFFLWVSPALFKVVNSAVFVLQLFLILYSAKLMLGGNKKEYVFKAVLLCAVFAALYLYMPAFGQVNLWLDGAVNYLWGSTASILYIVCILKLYVFNDPAKPRGIFPALICCVLGFAAGSWTENSGGALIIFMLGVIAAKLIYKEKITAGLIISAVCLISGFIFLLSAPAEMLNKVGDGFNVKQLYTGVTKIVVHVKELFWPLCIATVVLFVCCLLLYEDKKKTTYVFILIVAALAAAFCLAIGTYIQDRSFFFTVSILVLADAMMCAMLIDKKRELIFSMLAVLLLFLPEKIFGGISDIRYTYSCMKANEAYIAENVENGIYDISIPYVPSGTKYSAGYGLKYLDNDPDNWPNCYMAKYFGADRISCLNAGKTE